MVLLFNATRMQQIEDTTVVSGLVDLDGHLILEQRNGDSIDAGSVIGPAGADGVIPSMIIAYKPITDLPSTYLTGISIATTTPSVGVTDWPVTLGTIVTVRYGASRTVQTLTEKLTTRTYVRTDNSGAWTAWRELSADATDAIRGLVELATDVETITGTDVQRAVTPAGLAALTATDSRRGLIELATTSEVLAGTDTDRGVTPAGISRIRPWLPVIPTAVASSGATATFDSTTGVVTCPTGTTNLRIQLGTLDPLYEYEVIYDGENMPGHSTDYHLLMAFVEGTTPNVAASYNTGGGYEQYNGVAGRYSVGAYTYYLAGAVSGVGAYTASRHHISLSSPAALPKAWIIEHRSHTQGSARSTWGGGYGPQPTGATWSGLWFMLSAGSFRGKFTIYRRYRG